MTAKSCLLHPPPAGARLAGLSIPEGRFFSMPLDRISALKRSASVFALMLLALAALAAARIADLPGPHKSAELTAALVDAGDARIGVIEPAPFLRSASRSQTGLRGKPPAEPASKALNEPTPPRSPLAHKQASGRLSVSPSTSSFIARRALGPRAPPARPA